MQGADDDGARGDNPPEGDAGGADMQHHGSSSAGGTQNPLTRAVCGAQTGLKSAVQVLVDALAGSVVYIPLSEDIPDAPEGEEIDMGEELSFRPHMLLHGDGSAFAVAYTETELVEPLASHLDWKTSDGELKFIQVPSHVALELGQTRAADHDIAGLVVNPGTDEELVLQRDEVASIAQGKALPLVGYVDELPDGVDEQTQDVPDADPPPKALVDALEASKRNLDELADYEVKTTFNAERDREPHLTILLSLSRHGVDRSALADEVMKQVAEHLPAPGYADVVFRDPPN